MAPLLLLALFLAGQLRRVVAQTQTPTQSITQTQSSSRTASVTPSITLTPTMTVSQTRTMTLYSVWWCGTPRVVVSFREPSLLPAVQAGFLPAQFYSGSAGLRDPCARNLTSLYAFGAAVGDTSAKSDDGWTQLSLSGTALAFYESPYKIACVLANGAVILKAAGSSCSNPGNFAPVSPPYASLGGAGVLLFWQDIDTSPAMGTNGYPSAAQNTQYSERRAL